MSAYEEGKLAVYDAMNPYQNGTPAYCDWERGWNDGDDDAAYEHAQSKKPWYERYQEAGRHS